MKYLATFLIGAVIGGWLMFPLGYHQGDFYARQERADTINYCYDTSHDLHELYGCYASH